MEKKEPRGGGRWMGTGSAWPQVMAGLDRDQVEEIYIQKKKKEKKRNVITSLPGLPFCGPPKCFVHPQNQPRLPAAVAGPRAGQLRGAGRAQLIKNGNERRGPRAAVALQRCKLQEGFIGSFSFSGVPISPRPPASQDGQPLPAPLQPPGSWKRFLSFFCLKQPPEQQGKGGRRKARRK